MDSSPATNVSIESGRPGDPRPEWFERMWADSHTRIYNLAARIVGDRDDAADITQEVFLRAFTHPPDEQGLADPQPWLYRVTVNACYDHLRRRAVRPTAPLEHAGEIASSKDGFAAAEMTHAVEAALGTLTPRYRTALVLRDLHGLDTGEVAGVMGVSAGTARVLLHRSRAAFKRAFREAAPAGGAISVAGLAAFLPSLSVPAALQAPPPLAGIIQAAPVALSALPAAAAPAAAVPAAGLLAKIGGALGVKVATVIGAAAVVTGGAVAVHEIAPIVRDSARTAQPAANAVQSPVTGTGAGQNGQAGVTGSGMGSPGASVRAGAKASAGQSGQAGAGAMSGSGAGQGTIGERAGSGTGAGGSGSGSSGGSGSQGTQNPGASGSGSGGSGGGSGATGGGSGGSGGAGSGGSGAQSGADGAGGSGDSGGAGSGDAGSGGGSGAGTDSSGADSTGGGGADVVPAGGSGSDGGSGTGGGQGGR